MKVLSKVLLITLLATIFGLSGCNKSKVSEVKPSAIPLSVIKPSAVDKSVTVIFPQKANIKLVRGESKIGWVNINLQAKQVEVSLNNDSEIIDFNRIQKVNFDLNRATFNSSDIVIEGEESSNYVRDYLKNIPVTNFNLQQETGEVRVKLNNSVSNQISVVRDGIYIVEEIVFDESSQKMTLKVLCCTAIG
ncbi:hypothetical protein NIES267_71130 [Calothrix parasitica NIES-267]|uniref:Uncharacterized protein n=1 Tax=Calothrix parasitica NIES-267 TaxID=1973488 RepID=A0A1Z4M275_9CYAN|nr:hypothetical protein NIES267_71130 [Calothrix parasitica NIES-267]